MVISDTGIIVDGVKYLCLMYPSDQQKKKASLNDNIYYTLRDIFFNANSSNTTEIANDFNGQLTGNVEFIQKPDNFEYPNILEDIEFVTKLHNWLSKINQYWFEFNEIEEVDKYYIDMRCYIKFDDWMKDFTNLVELLEVRKNNLSNQINNNV